MSNEVQVNNKAQVSNERLPYILFADDDVGLCRCIEASLDCQPCRAQFAHTGDEALFAYEAARTIGDPFDLVVLDVMMPLSSGLSVAETIRERGDWETKIVFFTANNAEMTVARERTVKPSAVLQKPDGIVDLCAQVREILQAKQ